jgi:hypothetical protein
MSVADLREALRAELESTPEYFDFPVLAAEAEGDLWRLTLEPGAAWTDLGPLRDAPGRSGIASASSGEGRARSGTGSVLDDSFDDARAWWGAPRKGGASVLAVVPEVDQIVLRGATTPPPGAGLLIRLYPLRFLAALDRVWAEDAWAESAVATLPGLRRPRHGGLEPLPPGDFGWLRDAQRRAFGLLGFDNGFLWGPPWTGKTTLIGVLLARYLEDNPTARVLLLSTTNQAVDQATVAVDRALEQSGRHALRRGVKRIGSQFLAGLYAGREHLLPVVDRELVQRLTRLEAARPRSDDLDRLELWRARVSELRRQLRSSSIETLAGARLASMTTIRATFGLSDLRKLPAYDLVVFDEASQVALAQALALMPLGRARLFAGDPRQLSPVVRAETPEAKRWLARSVFSEMPPHGSAVCLLDEQSRMAAPICELVSEVFYDGALRVASDALEDPRWCEVRDRAFGDLPQGEHVVMLEVPAARGRSAVARGPTRPGSAEQVASLVHAAMDAGHALPAEIVVLTPFRAQRALIAGLLARRGLAGVKVSTVHRAQGSEAAFVVFDPVDGLHPFLATDAAMRLVNVALSRAQARVVLLMSEADRTSPVLGRLWNRNRLRRDDCPVAGIGELTRLSGFPSIAVGKTVAIGRHVGEVKSVSRDGSQLILLNRASGAEQVFDVLALVRKFGGAG